jgi:FkbM family methyltransferase
MNDSPALLPPVTPGAITGRLMQDLIANDAPLIVEIGANDGSHTLEFLKLFPRARIFAFEPDQRAFTKLKANVVNRGVVLYNVAVGAKDGEAQFHVSSGLPPNSPPRLQEQYAQGWDQSGSLRAPKTHATIWPWCKFEQTIVVPVKRLDSWSRENGVERIDFIWADVQGAEGDLIEGGHETLAKTRFFYTEYSNDEWYEGQPNLNQLMTLLPNFSVLQRYSMDVLFKNNTL